MIQNQFLTKLTYGGKAKNVQVVLIHIIMGNALQKINLFIFQA
jgi:hypothetical protein